MRETELKAVVPDESACVDRLVAAGARLVVEGRLMDRRYDFPDRRLTARDKVLRLRVRQDGTDIVASLDWKGPASFAGGYKHRDETTLKITEPVHMAGILEAVGFIVTRAIDRDIRTFQLGQAMLRFAF